MILIPDPAPAHRTESSAARRQFVRGMAFAAAASCATEAFAQWEAPRAALVRQGWLHRAPARVLRLLAALEAIVEGGGARSISIFFDLLCPACRLLYQRTRVPVGRSFVRLQWIPVAILGRESLLAAAHLLSRPNRPAALARAMQGGFAPAEESPWQAGAHPAQELAVLANSAMLRTASGAGAQTPSLLALDAGGSWQMSVGVPEAF